MSGLTTFEEKRIIPYVTTDLRENKQGLTLNEMNSFLLIRGISITAIRLDYIVAILESAGICSQKRDGDTVRYVPNEQLFFSTEVN